VTHDEFQQFVMDELAEIEKKIIEIEEGVITKEMIDSLVDNQDLLQKNQKDFRHSFKSNRGLIDLFSLCTRGIGRRVDAIFREHENRRRQIKEDV
jgi:hypothetical protein